MPVVDSEAFNDLKIHDQELLVRQQINFAIESDGKIVRAFENAIRRYEAALSYVSDSEETLPRGLVELAGTYFTRVRFLKDLKQQLDVYPVPEPIEMTAKQVAGAIAITAQQKAINVNKKYEISKTVATGGAQITKQVGGWASWIKKSLKTGDDHRPSKVSGKNALMEDESPLGVSRPSFEIHLPSQTPPAQSSVMIPSPVTNVLSIEETAEWSNNITSSPMVQTVAHAQVDPFEAMFSDEMTVFEMATPPQTPPIEQDRALDTNDMADGGFALDSDSSLRITESASRADANLRMTESGHEDPDSRSLLAPPVAPAPTGQPPPPPPE